MRTETAAPVSEGELGHLDEDARERQAESCAQPRAQDAPCPRTPREAHALERAQRRHVGEREDVLDDVLCEESREPAHVGFRSRE